MSEGTLLSKVPPHSAEAEEAVLGAMLQNNEAFYAVIGRLKEESFYIERHRLLFKTILAMHDKNIDVNIETVLRYLVENKMAESIVGTDMAFLQRLVDVSPVTRNAEYYASIVSGKALMRELISASYNIQSLCFEATEESVKDIADEAERLVFNVTKERLSNNFTGVKELLIETMKMIEDRTKLKTHTTGVPSGYTELDKLTGGFQPADLIILAARPSMGKTSFALNIAENVVSGNETSNYGVGIFSLEMSKLQIAERLISSKSLVSLSKIRSGIVSSQEWVKLGVALNSLYNSNIFIDDSNPISIMEIRGKARQMESKFREIAAATGRPVALKIIIVDYLQLITAAGSKRNESREQVVSDISRGLKSLAKELRVPVIALSQLNRETEKRDDKRPRLSDLRESGSIEQDADVVMFLHSDKYYDRGEGEEAAEAIKEAEVQVIIAKHRNGALGDANLMFIKELTRFQNRVNIRSGG
ncbi:MAG: replicative DNA helicase [Spirochaetes bacterium]|nr:replicative DNA helicase [Spirochaetota bacterium]